MALNAAQQLMKRILGKAAKTYVVGPDLGDAIRVAKILEGTGMGSTVAFWDGPNLDVKSVGAMYFASIGEVSRCCRNCYVSVKAPSIGYDSSVVRDLLDYGRDKARIHFDSLGWEQAPLILRLIDRFPRDAHRIGLTLPGRWSRSLRDAESAVERGLFVRLVKGQWPDRAGSELEGGRGMTRLAEILAGRVRRAAVASHDPVVARRALNTLLQAGTPCELELLYGLPSQAALGVAKELGVPVRFYLPFGHAWLPYALRQAVHRPKILYWVMRDALTQKRELPLGASK